MFADVALARRIEDAERLLVTEGAETLRQAGRDVLIAPLAGGVAVFAGAGAPLNKFAGLGFAGPVDESDLESIEREFERRGAPLQAELSSLAETSIGMLLTKRGYILVGYENVSGLRLDPASVAHSSQRPEQSEAPIAVTGATREEIPIWMETAITGFQHPDDVEGLIPHESFEREALERFMADFKHTPGYRLFFARRNGAVAGCASMRLCNGVAQLCGAATLPEHRRRGVQSALLRARLADAAIQGCDIAVMTTQPGSKSQQNAIRQGFSILYTRAILRRG